MHAAILELLFSLVQVQKFLYNNTILSLIFQTIPGDSMKRYPIRFTLLLSLLLCLCSCDKPGEPVTPPPPAAVKTPLKVAIDPVSYELSTGALATWRDFAAYKPALVLFSSHPMLNPIEEETIPAVRTLILNGEGSEIIQRGRLWSADPVFLAPQTVSAAIATGLISELIIVRPDKKTPEEFSLDNFRQQFTAAGFLTQREAQSLTLTEGGVVNGKIRGIPLRVVHPDRLPKLSKPVLLHIDLGYFKDLYINEIKTPTYDLIHNLAIQIKDATFPALATTVSFSNQESGYSLESRFMIRDLAELLRNPKLLEDGTPASWALRASALYASTMFSESQARALTQQAVAATPEDAAAHYALALDLFEEKLNEQAFIALSQATKLDHGYALEYILLAERGFELGQYSKALDLLHSAVAALPNSPILRLQLAKQLINAGRGSEALPIITELKSLKWSEKFHPGALSLLGEMEQIATANTIPRLPDASPQSQRTPGGMPGFNHGMAIPGQ